MRFVSYPERPDSVKYLIDSGQVDGDIVEYIEWLEGSIVKLDDVLEQVDSRIARAIEELTEL